MKKTAIIALCCFFTLSGVSFARGQGAPDGFKMPHGKWWQVPEVAEALDLTTEEQQRLDELFLESERKLIDLRTNVQKQQLELETILDQADFDRSACLDQFNKLLDARIELGKERFGFHVEVRELLGLDRYRQLRATLRDRFRHGKRGGPGCNGRMKGGTMQQ